MILMNRLSMNRLQSKTCFKGFIHKDNGMLMGCLKI